MRGVFCSLLLCALLSCSGKPGVHTAVERMMADYPASTLQDIYKSFFQDRFGPGHIVADTAQAAAYLRRELGTVENLDVKLYEPTGEHGNYYRVALAVIASGKIPFDTYLSCFLRSVREVEPVDVEEWAAEWAQKEMVIASMDLGLPGYAKDAAAIEEMLSSGHYAVHHSKLYNVHYAPHYRIIAKDIFEAEILPLLEGN